MFTALTIEMVAYRRWEIRGRPSYGADYDWRGAERLRRQLIEEAAYFHWVNRGRPFGDPLTDWFAAEAEVVYRRPGHRDPADRTMDERVRRQIIEETAYFHWFDRGRPFEDPQTDWFTAEAEMIGDSH